MSTKFFTQENTKRIINSYRDFLEKATVSNEFEQKRNQYLQVILKSFNEVPEMWDLYCQINIEFIGESLLIELNPKEPEPNNIDNVYSTCFRFFLEREISNKSELSPYFREIKTFTIKQIDNFSISAKEQIEYAIRDMPTAILKEIISDSNMTSVKEFIELSKKSEDLIRQWNIEIAEKETRVNQLKEALSKYENAFNFVGLHDGFKTLSDEKTTEKEKASRWLIFLALAALSPLIYEMYFLSNNEINYTSLTDYFSLIPMFSITIILIYYFKIALQNYNSVKAQLAQIELRKTLCRFIQNYGDYSIGMKQQDPDSLAKFENIIFSSIVTNGDNVPATFDGLEQIAKIIGNLKNSK
ncbi:TPA: hypothetical protein ACPTCW_000848 [Yersinia enterocolitica]